MQVRHLFPSRQPKSWVMVLLVFGLVLLCYWPALQGAILWDDPAHITRAELRSWAGLLRIWTDVHATQQFYPVLFSAFWIEHQLWGDTTLGYHLVNVILHATSCCLLALILRRLWSTPTASVESKISPARIIPPGTEWFAALLFAVHPICVESVAWITEQKNTLSLMFYLLAGLAYLEFAAHRRRLVYGLATGLFLLALGSKTATVTLPAALLVVLWWKNGKLSWRRDINPLIPWLLAATAMGLFTSWDERKVIGAEGADFELALGDRVFLAGKVIWFYVGKMVWPVDLNFFYPRWDVASAATSWTGWLLTTAGVTIALWLQRCRGLLAGWLFFVGSLFPILGFFKVYFFIFSYVNDHFLYLASLGFIATATGGIALLLTPAPVWMRLTGRGIFGLLLIVLVVQSNRQSRLYRDNETLFRATIARNPDSWMGHHILGFALAKTPDRHTEAIAQFEEALRLNPKYPDAHLALAIELARLPGRKAEAIAHYEKAIELRPNYAEAHNNLGVELEEIPERAAAAQVHYEAALRTLPNFAEAHHNLGNILLRLPGRLPEAIAHYQTALRLKPDYTEAHFGLANALAKIPNRIPEAIAQYELTLQLKPDSAAAHFHLANTLAQLPARRTEALPHYAAVLRLKPESAEAHANMANVLTTLPGRVPEAIAHYETALQLNPALTWVHQNLAQQLAQIPGREADAVAHGQIVLNAEPDNVEIYNTLAIIYASHGQFEPAKALWERALQLNPNDANIRQNLQRLEQLQKN